MSTFAVWLGSISGFGSIWLFGMLIAQALRAARRRRSMAILSYVEQGMRLYAPLPEFLNAAALGETGRVRRHLMELHQLLLSGAEVPVAIQTVAPSLPVRSIDLIGAAWRNGNTSAALRPIIEEQRGKLRGDPITSLYLRWYPPLLLLALAMTFSTISIFILPKYIDILKDFHVAMPRSTRLAMEFAVPLAPIIGLLVLLWIWSVAFYHAIRFSRNAPERSGPGWFWSAIIWRMPFVGAATRGRAFADAMGVMADALAAGRPMQEALDEASGLRNNAVLRRRLSRWAEFVNGGMPLNEAARQAGLPRLISGTLAMAQMSAGEQDALRFLQRHYGGIFSRRAIVFRAAMVPVVVLSMGAMVTFAGLALFEPLIALINILSPDTRGL
jgi:type II secretory pathway component PulF